MKRIIFPTMLLMFLNLGYVHAQEMKILTEKHPGLIVKIRMDDVPNRNALYLNYEISNETDSVISFPYSYYWDFPVGMFGMLTKRNGKSLVRFGSRHVLADEYLANKDFNTDRLDLKPGGTVGGMVNLLDMIIMNDQFGKATLKPGRYMAGLRFFGNESNLVEVTIPKE
jgi:hypothetical protein